MRAVPAAAVALVRAFEGCRLAPYRDAVGLWTIGWGHLVTRDRAAPAPPAISQEDADALLAADLAGTAGTVVRLVRVALTDGQFGALVSFAFNVGGGNLQASTLLRLVNRAEHEGVPAQFGRWVHAGGVRLAGLVRRRTAEAALYAGR